jgi:molecular chaperone GrpE (heat shock protein)
MTEQSASATPALPKLPWWPFFLGDALLLGLAGVIYWQGGHPPFGTHAGLAPWEAAAMAGCVLAGGWLFVTPFLLQYRAWARLAEISRVDVAIQQVQNIEQIGRQIGSASSSWHSVHTDATKVMQAAQGILERMSAEARAFAEFMQKQNEAERQHLRLEVDKLRRAESEWLQALVRVLDHVYAIYQAAVRSGRVNLVEQFSQFQRVCRDAAQRVGLVPLVARAGDAFDPSLHQPTQPPDTGLTDPRVGDTMATGFKFQGQLIRKVLVTLQAPTPAQPETEPAPAPESAAPTEPAPAPVPSGSGQTELTLKLATGLQAGGDTEFVRAVAREMDEANSPGSAGNH